MANITIPVSDDKILEHLREEHGFDEGKSNEMSVEVEAQAPTQNSAISHVVTVSVRYGLKLGEIEKLAGL